MGKNVKDSISGALSANKSRELNTKRLGKRKKPPSTSDSQQKNVRFDCIPAEKDHVKYVTTPFLSSVKKEKAKINNSVEKIKNTKKLSFDEEKTDQLEEENATREDKVQSKKKLSFVKGNINKSEETLKKKKKLSLDKGKTNESNEESENKGNLPLDEGKANKSGGKSKNKKKPSFEEGNTYSVKKMLPKKRKLDPDQGKTLDNVVVKESQGTGNKKKKAKIESPGSEGTIQNSDSAPDAPAGGPINEKECTIFVGNLPLTYDHKKIVKLFNKFGPIASARIRCVPVASANVPKKTTAITKKFNPKRNSANAYVVFKSKESVQKALAENGMVVDGHHLRIDNAKAKKKDSNKSIFVGGLPFDVEDDDLWDTFKDCGEIEDVRIVRDNVIGMGKGFGYVNFKSIASVELALELNGHEIKNRKINVQRCVNKKKKGYEKLASVKTKKTNKKARLADSKGGKELSGDDFQGRTAEQKKKKKKNKKSADTLRKNKMKKVLGSTPKNVKKDKSKAPKPK